ncbi:MAG: AraC family transcriptional regulator [Cyanobacteria bacterium P01_D01_bin.14]
MTQPSCLTYADIYQQHDVFSAFPREHRQAGSIPVEFVRIQQADCESIIPATHAFALGLALKGRVLLHADFGEGVRQMATADIHSSVAYLNPTLSDVWYRQIGHPDLLLISAPLVDIAAKLEIETSVLNHALRPLHDYFLQDSRIHTHCLTLWEQAAQAGPFASLAVDQGLLALVTMLMARARPGPIPAKPTMQGLDAERLARVRDYVQASLEQPFNLSDLAKVAGLSLSLFSRSFKAATGQSPHQYVLSLRVQKTRELLAFSYLSIAEIAATCGFYDQAHLTRAFKKQLGTTPGAYRQEVQG